MYKKIKINVALNINMMIKYELNPIITQYENYNLIKRTMEKNLIENPSKIHKYIIKKDRFYSFLPKNLISCLKCS